MSSKSINCLGLCPSGLSKSWSWKGRQLGKHECERHFRVMCKRKQIRSMVDRRKRPRTGGPPPPSHQGESSG